MKSLKILLGLSMSVVGAGAVGFGVVASNKQNLKAATAEVPTNQRRVWIVDNNGDSSDTNWWTSSTMYAYAWNENGNVTVKCENKVLDDYGCGLHYVDITLAGATEALNVIVRIGNDEGPYNWSGNNQSFAQSLGKLGTEDVIWLNNGVSWNGTDNRNDRNSSKGTAGCNAAQLAVVISKYDTCSDAVTDGYHAYPQVFTDFYQPSDASTYSTYVYGQETYTIQQAVEGMEVRHNANK